MIALAFRPGRIKHRDLWDIVWLKQQGVELPLALIPKKIKDHKRTEKKFLELIKEKLNQLPHEKIQKEFLEEMRRFLPTRVISETVGKKMFWSYCCDLLITEGKLACSVVKD